MLANSLIKLIVLLVALSVLLKSARAGARCDEESLHLSVDTKGAGKRQAALLSPPMPAYWINLASSVERKRYMKQMLALRSPSLGIGHHKRIEAVTPESPAYNVTRLEKPCKRNTPNDLAIIMSHLAAMRTAVYDQHQSVGESQYALILEDDVEFLFDIDLYHIVRKAPPGFGILQLMTSNIEAIDELWNKYTSSGEVDRWTLNHWTNTTGNGKYARYWGALGYIINKQVVKPFLDDVVTHDAASGLNSYKLVNSFFANGCKRTRDRPCVLANCLFSDTYIYSGAGPTYVHNVPLITSGKAASTSHQNHIEAHVKAFQRIKEITDAIRDEEAHKQCLGHK